MPKVPQPEVNRGTRFLHYALVALTGAAWVSAGFGSDDGFVLHRTLGAVAGIFLLFGWADFAALRGTRRKGGAWSEGLRALGQQFSGSGHGERERDQVLRLFVPCGLIASTLVIVSGLPSMVRMDGLFQPATWVLAARQVHALAGAGLLTLWMADMGSALCLWLERHGRGRAPVHPGPAAGAR